MKEVNTDFSDLDGLSGWLILVGVSIILTPLVTIINTFPGYFAVLSKGYLGELMTHGSNAYDPVFASVLIGEMVTSVILIFLFGYVAYLFFTKKKSFPKWYIGILILTVILILVDSWGLSAFIPSHHFFNPNTLSEFIQTLVWAVVWTPYMFLSKRVKATFTR